MGVAVVNRETLVEKAALASHRWGLECGGEYAEWDALRESVRRDYRSEAADVVDALLPQVTTVEELEALPSHTVIVTPEGGPLEKMQTKWLHMGALWASTAAEVVECSRERGPLTVVWKP